ncbi:MAG: hypothetical protein QM754_02200 [Tepidisphaeraceae bacterium]
MGQATRLTRTELYEKLWAEPTTRVARTYGISDVGLAKLCDRHDIPRPPRGYWARLQHGQHPPKTPLPNPDQNQTIELADRPSLPDVEKVAGKVQPIPIRVADSLRECLDLVSRAKEELQAARTDEDGIIIAAERRALDIRTSKNCVYRALLIFDAVLKECMRHSFPVGKGPAVTVEGHSITLGIHEIVDSVREPDDGIDFNKPYEFGHSRVKSRRVATGRLVLSITDGRDYWAVGTRSSWRDTDKQRIEERLDKVIPTLVRTAEAARQHKEEQKQRAEKERLEAIEHAKVAEQRAKRLKQHRAEKINLTKLLEESEDFHRSKKLRNFIAAVRAKHEQNGQIDPDSEISRWLEWAMHHADRIDPLTESQPSILDEHFQEDDPRPTWGVPQPAVPKSYWEQRNWWNRNR